MKMVASVTNVSNRHGYVAAGSADIHCLAWVNDQIVANSTVVWLCQTAEDYRYRAVLKMDWSAELRVSCSR